MTGPRISAVHPHRRRGRHLLPFLAILLTPLACTDHSTEPRTGPSAATGRLHPYHVSPRSQSAGGTSSIRVVSPRVPASLVVAGASSGAPAKVLILADIDGGSTTGLADALAGAGFEVTVRSAPEYTWNGTDPALDGFSVVIHLNGATYFEGLPPSAQGALNSFVQNGGGFIGSQWNQYEFWSSGSQTDMPDLVLQKYGEGEPTENCAPCLMTFTKVAGRESHPVLAGFDGSFSFTADAHDASPARTFESGSQPTVLMTVPSGFPGVLVREFGSGKVVNFSFAPNYPNSDMETGFPLAPATLEDADVKQLYINAVRWTAGLAASVEAQTITFGPLADKTYGDPAFAVNASASSGLTVSFSAGGQCTVTGSTVTITAPGTCTITAHQAGNEAYQPAADVAQSFTINPAAHFSFKGFHQPVRNLPARNRVKAGRAVTMKFSIGGYHGRDIIQSGSPTSRDVACNQVPSERTLEGTKATAKNGLYYNRRTGRYEYVWRTDPRWGGTCRVFALTLVDGTTHEALFRFVKKQGREGDRDRDDDDDRNDDD